MKRTIAMLTALMMTVSLISGCGQLIGTGKVHAENYRNGIGLTPLNENKTGVAVDSDFLITFEEGISLSVEEITNQLTIEPAVSFEVRDTEEGIVLSLNEAMVDNSIYKFMIEGTVWTYQTQRAFEVLGNLPRDKSTNVPVNTGIELYFSHEGADVEDYFEIEPRVSGRFERYGNTVVFVSTSFVPQTMYTVTLKAGMTMAGSDETLAESYSFSFETTGNESQIQELKGYFNYNRVLNDLSTKEEALIPFEYSIYNREQGSTTIETSIYDLKGYDALVEKMTAFISGPTWRYYAPQPATDIRGLKKVIQFDQELLDINGYQGMLEIPVNLNKGVYLIQSTWMDVKFQTFLQVTDLGYYYFSDDQNDYYWVHDLGTEQKALGAVAEGIPADDNGLIKLDKKTAAGLRVTYIESGADRVMHYQYSGADFEPSAETYWSFFTTDRTAYKSQDTVKFFGFLKERGTGNVPSTLTVELRDQPRYFDWFWFGGEQEVPLTTFNIAANHGFYEGEVALPQLDEGGYRLQIKRGDEVLVSHYLQVENYVKPDYKLTINKDKKAIFLNETVNYDLKTAFFEGTAVPGLDLGYEIYGMSYERGELITDGKGLAQVAYTPKTSGGQQGINYDGISVYAKLPESGEIYENEQVRVFINDIDVAIDTKIDGDKGKVEVQVNNITLDRLNDGTSEDDSDYLDGGVNNHLLKGTIYRNQWVKEITGERYDFINKVVIETYRYNKETEKLSSFEVTTDDMGLAKFDVQLPKEDEVYYTLEMSTVDLKGRPMKFDRSFYEYRPYQYDESAWVSLKSDKEVYHVGDVAQLEVIKNDTPVESKEFLFVLGTEGVADVQWRSVGNQTIPFEESYVPGLDVVAVIFNGASYETAERSYLAVDQEDYAIDLKVTTNKSTYRPGDKVVVRVNARWRDNEQTKTLDNGVVNLNLVDESYLALYDQTTDPLTSLYRRRSTGMVGFYGSHNNQNNSQGYFDVRYTMAASFGVMEKGVEMVTAEMDAASSESLSVRKDFKDTALFASVELDSQGDGVFEFTLPDNVTSWRLTAAAVSESLGAGSEVKALNVSLPFFVSPTLNSTYLVGDKPFIGLTSYGAKLEEGSQVTYKVTCRENDYEISGSGDAFERLYLPLFELEEGTYHIQVTAENADGLRDAYEEVVEVVDTYQQHRAVELLTAKEGLTLTPGEGGLTTITFSDQGKGMYLPLWYRLSYAGGKRVDQQYLGTMATEIMEEIYGIERGSKDIKLSEFVTEEGGIALLPYSESDLLTTVKLISHIEDPSVRARVKSYLYNAYYSSGQDNKALVLYGLAAMGESVLIDINRLNNVDNLSEKDRLYLAMAYGVSGDGYMAEQIYRTYFEQYIEEFDQIAKYNKGDKEAMFQWSSELLPLLAMFDKEMANKIYGYVISSYSELYLPNLDLFDYAKRMMASTVATAPQVTYSYEGTLYQVDFETGTSKSIELPSTQLDSFKLESVVGELVLVTEFNQTGTMVSNRDQDVKVTRKFVDPKTGEIKTNFATGDMVKVVLDWAVLDVAIESGYTITDYAPSGLMPLSNPRHYGLENGHYWYNDVEGQQVQFGVYKGNTNYRPMVYFARVVSPGTFKADPAMIQGNQIKDSYNLSESDVVTITP